MCLGRLGVANLTKHPKKFAKSGCRKYLSKKYTLSFLVSSLYSVILGKEKADKCQLIVSSIKDSKGFQGLLVQNKCSKADNRHKSSTLKKIKRTLWIKMNCQKRKKLTNILKIHRDSATNHVTVEAN